MRGGGGESLEERETRRIIDFSNSVETQREFLILKEAQYEGKETANKGEIESEGVH
jgi:hypothetical protein